MVPDEYGIFFYLTYRRSPRIDYRSDIADTYEKPVVQNRYKIRNESIEEFKENPKDQNPIIKGDGNA